MLLPQYVGGTIERNKIQSQGENTFVTDYVWQESQGKHGINEYTYDKLKEEMLSFASEPAHMSTYELQ